MTLVEFLLARIAEDEAVANEKHEQYVCNLRAVEFFGSDACECHYPARVLAECGAKRRIITDLTAGMPDELVIDGFEHEGWDRATELVLRLIALPYAGHPDYQTEWAA